MVIAAISLVVFVGAILLQNVLIRINTPFWGLFGNHLDLDVYRAGAQTVLDGGSLYDAKLLGQMDYTYAPISALLFIPFAWMSFDVARIVWTAAIFVALYLVMMLSFRSLGRQPSWMLRTVALALVAVAMLLEPVRTTIWYGQVNVFLMLLILADLLRPDDSRLRGVGAGIAAGIKLTPLLFVVYLWLVQRKRAAIGVLAGFAGTIVVGAIALPRESLAYWTGKMFDANRVSGPQTVGNQSIRGLLANSLHSDHPNTILWGLLALVALAIGLYAAVLAHRNGQELLALSITGMTSCAVSPVAWGHHWVWFVPLLAIGINLVLRQDLSTRNRALAGAGVTALVLTALAWRTYISHPIWYVNRSVPDAYFTGLFFKNGIEWLRWFTYYPYNAIFLGTVIATIVVYRTRRSADGADDAADPSRLGAA